jgi:hypothetical protein
MDGQFGQLARIDGGNGLDEPIDLVSLPFEEFKYLDVEETDADATSKLSQTCLGQALTL